MATIKVSSQSQLNSGLKAARGGDTIALDGGTYSINVNGNQGYGNLQSSGTVTVTSAGNRKAEFSSVSLKQVDGFTFEDVVFDGRTTISRAENVSINNVTFEGGLSRGYGTGSGLTISDSSDVLVQNSDFNNLEQAVRFWGVDDLRVRNNDFDNISRDGMVFGDVEKVLVQGNSVEMNSPSSISHKDMIQFWNETKGNNSRDVTIRDNDLEAGESSTHGIYMGNGLAGRTGSRSDFYEDVLIENNTVRSGQTLGIAVGQTDGLVVRNNVVLQHEDINSGRGVNIPVIRVENDSRDVQINGNISHAQPIAAGNNWQPSGGGDGWSIYGNKTVSLGTSAKASSSGREEKVETVDAPEARSTRDTTSTQSSSSLGDGDADAFRFDGGRINGTERDRLNIDFSEGDRLILNGYDRSTFEDVSGGNIVQNNARGDFVRIDSLTDIQELADSSRDIRVSTNGDTLVLNINQDDGAHQLILEGLGREYQQTFDDALF